MDRSAADALAQQIRHGSSLRGGARTAAEFPIELMREPTESPEGTLVTTAIRDISIRKDAKGTSH